MKIKDIFTNTDSNRLTSPYLIAEAGVNHEGSMEIAKRLITEAKEGGADAIKFQTYKAEMLTSKNSPAYWDLHKEPTKSQYQLFKKYDKFWKKEYEELKKYCDENEIDFLSTPFDHESVKFLNDLMDAYKISSSDITNKPFIEYICDFKKPIILSTGASYLDEISKAVNWIKKFQNNLCLLHCILNYPTKDENANLGMIIDLKINFPECLIGYSDHTLPNDMKILEIATLLGAKVIEKHFTHDKKLTGNDHYHSANKNDLKVFKNRISFLLKCLGSFDKSVLESEKIARINARRSLFLKKSLLKGTVITKDHLISKRPLSGISPENIEDVLGKKLKKDVTEEESLKWEYFE